MQRHQLIIIGVFWLFCFSCLPAHAQQETGSITGRILDPTGGVLPGAQVTIKNRATGAAFAPATDVEGFYRAPQLAPGLYDISAVAKGFSTLVLQAVEVRVNDRLRVDLTLQVGAVNEQIVVTAGAPLVQTEDATMGQVVNTQQVLELPLNGRSWLQLATLAPATVTYSNTLAAGSIGTNMNLGGLRGNQALYLLDGSDNTVYVAPSGAVGNPPVDSIQEFKVQTNNYTADMGHLGGAVVNATIMSGSNAFHGTAYEFFRNRALNARNFFESPTGNKAQFTRNQFGASLGGPFWRNKLFFFLNYEGTRQRQAQTVTRQVFTDAQKAGDFSPQLGGQIGSDALGNPVLSGEIFDPLSLSRLPDGTAIRNPFPNNVIPVSRFSPVAKQLINLVPPPNNARAPNFVRNLGNPFNIDAFVGRIDLPLSEKNNFFSHFLHSDQQSFTDPILGLPIDGAGASINGQRARHFTLGWTHIFNPTTVNEFRAGYVRNASIQLQAQYNQDLDSKYGLPFPSPSGPSVGGMSTMTISGFTSLGSASFGPGLQYIDKGELSDSYTAIRGRHTLKFGVRAGLKTFYNQVNCLNCRGSLTFNGAFTQQPGFGASGSGAADFLLGVASSALLYRLINEKDIGYDTEAYAQEKWMATSKLTISVGLLYEYNPPSWENRDRIASVVFGPGFTNPEVVVPKGQDDTTFNLMKNTWFSFIPVGRATDLDRGLAHNTYLDFSPRVGIAYAIGPKTELRTGYGVFRGYPEQVSAAIPTVNPPSQLIVSSTSNNIDPTLSIDRSVFGPTPFNTALVYPGFQSIRDPYLPSDFTQMYNLSIQHALTPNWLVEIGFVGNRSSHVAIVTQINDARPALPTDSSSLQSRRMISTALGVLPYLAPQGFSNYNALTLNVEKRFSAGLSLLTNYTWSRALGVAPAFVGGINGFSVQNPYDLKREYGPLEFDIISHVSIGYVYELPFGKGRRFLSGVSHAVDQVLGGWQINGIATLQGGFPITPVLGYSLGKTGTNSRPDAIGDPTKSARQPYQWINPAAFVVPSNAQIAAGDFFGNSGEGCMREPGLVNFDLSIFKIFALRERMRLQFRAEFFNASNTPFFGLPGAVDVSFSSSTFGRVTTAGSQRVTQLALKLIF